MTTADIHKGLAGVVVDTTAISKVVPETNSLTYRGYPVQDLAAHCSFEQVAYLLWHGELPTDAELALFCQRERAARRVDQSLLSLWPSCPTTATRWTWCAPLISYLGAEDPTEDDSAEAANTAKALRMFAVLPTVVAVDLRRRRGLAPVAPHSHLGYAENFLQMCFGEVPDQVVVSAFEQSMILYAEHGFNASTFAARVVTSTQSDIYSAVTAAIGALKGPLHGGANEAVMHDDDRDRRAGQCGGVAARHAGRKEKVMGFGHRVYKDGDSRVPTMKAALPRSRRRAATAGCEIYGIVETRCSRHGLNPNLDFPDRSGVLPDGFRHRDVHADLRDEPDHRLDRARHRADRGQLTDPPAEPVRGTDQRRVGG